MTTSLAHIDGISMLIRILTSHEQNLVFNSTFDNISNIVNICNKQKVNTL